ncbi:MAG: helix-turn-helix transcriptional regulator [Ruminococcus sp.]|nr:helix-turn-helix transcriptional regulator [Ruminococcus sp.]
MGYYQRLKDLKEDADLTQKEVAEIIGVSVNHYGKYERGETDIPFEKVISLAEYYGVSLDYIAGRTNSKNPNENLTISDIYNKLSERDKGKLELFAEMLMDKRLT